MAQQAELVREMLAKHLKKTEKFDKYVNKVDKDESKTLDKKEWKKLLKKVKKKDDSPWELTSELSGLCFKLVQACGGTTTRGNTVQLMFSP